MKLEARKCSNSVNNNDSGSSSTSDDNDGQVSILCEETSALFNDILRQRCASGAEADHKVQLVWKQVDYSVETSVWRFPSLQLCTRTKKRILNNNSGRIESESLTAVIGPSGAGKSSLLEILAGRREKGVTGSIAVHYGSRKHASKTKIAFMGQKDLFCGNLTVKETLMFASKLKNYAAQSRLFKKMKAHKKSNDITITPMQMHSEAKNFHANLVAEILEELFLSSCAHVHVSNCSGGQQKRLSIACELISRPDILLLDEPTSGLGKIQIHCIQMRLSTFECSLSHHINTLVSILSFSDSFSAFQCIQLLKKLTQSKSLAVILSIHQPSSQTLNLFDKLYVISHDGQCLYSGETAAVLPLLKEQGLECPMFYNPADFVIEIASGDHGQECMNQLAMLEEDRQKGVIEAGDPANEVKLSRVVEKMMRKPLPLLTHTWTLLKRSLLLTWREPMLASLSLFQHVFVGLIMGVIFSTSSGRLDGCYKPQHTNPSQFTLETLKDFQREEIFTQQNVGFLFFSLIFLFLASMMATVLTFPLEMGVFIKERTNRWYSCASYYLARTIADTPYRILFPLIYAVIIYRMTGQIDDNQRFLGFVVLYIFVAFVAQAKGLLIGSLYANDVSSAVFVAPLSCIPVVLFAGFFVKLEGLPSYLSALPIVSYFKVRIPNIPNIDSLSRNRPLRR